ncbi:MAG: sigma-70 family RNA polymerase sigma factor [Actinomycetales bacterium]|nr:sigma-70 family RNA polymerase sigma factor [Actinomycetales bacterium]
MAAQAPGSGRDDTELVLAARGHEPGAYGELFHRWYDRCYDVAWNIVRDRETAADVAQDAFLQGWEHLAELRDPTAFGGWILRATRNRALNHLRGQRAHAQDPIDDQPEGRMAMPAHEADPALLSESDDRRRLVWTAAAALGERDTSLLDLHLRHGLEPAEIAEEMQITPNNAHQLLFRLRGKLRETIGAALLWREGRPTCERLAALLPASSGFDGAVAAAVRRHQRDCESCAHEVSRQTHPERLFAAIPFAVAPAALKTRAMAALREAGVPVADPGSAAAAGGAGAGSGGAGAGGAGAGSDQAASAGVWTGTGQGTGPTISMGQGTGPTIAMGLGSGPPAGSPPSAGVRLTKGLVAAILLGALLLGVATGVAVRSLRGTVEPAPAGVTPPAVVTSAPPTTAASPTVTTAPSTSASETSGTSTSSSRTTSTTTTSSTTTSTSTATTVAGPPEVTLSLAAGGSAAAGCPSDKESSWRLTWTISGADTAELGLPSGTITIDPEPGSQVTCLVPGARVTLVATGAGGRASTSAVAPRTVG